MKTTRAPRSREVVLRRFIEEVVGISVIARANFEETYRGYSDTLEAECLIHSLPQEQLEVLVCLHFGMRPADIVKTLKYTNIIRYYNVSAKLRKLYLEQKPRYLNYNV